MKKSTALFFAVFCSFLLAGSMVHAADKTGSVYDRVMNAGKIRCGYIVWPPEMDKDLNTGELSGINYDIMNELGRRLGLKVEWTEEVNFITMTEGLKADRYDLVCFSSYRRSQLARQGDFTAPLFYTGTGVFVRADDNRFTGKDLSVFNDPAITVATMDGDHAETIAREQFPLAKQFSIPQNSDFSQILLNVIQKKADVTFVNQANAREFMKNNPGKVVDISGDRPIRVFSHGYIYKKGETEWGKTLDLVLDEMHDQGFIERILKKYDEEDKPLFMPVARPYSVSE